MGRSRQPQADTTGPRLGQAEKIKAAAAIAAVLMATAATPRVSSVAGILKPLIPSLPLGVVEEAARMVLIDPLRFDPGAGEFERRASLENVLYRGFYGVSALRRLAKAWLEFSDTPAKDRLAQAIRAERSHLTAHQNARTRNLEGAKRTDGARELFGDVVSWNHGVHRKPVEPRLAHIAADGKTWDLRRGVPISTGGLPRTLPFCSCDWGPAKAGAQALV